MLKACIGLRQLDFIDRRHWGLQIIPEDVYRHERTLEELLLDFNRIQELPPKFFTLTGLRKLTVSENDLNRIPPGISNFTRLAELDLSKNAIEDIPLNMQFCRMLRVLDISSNPLLRTPENISAIRTLVHLCINDVGIPRLPLDIGNLTNLVVLEARENALKTLPVSIGKLKKLQRLDVGNNEIELLPAELGELLKLSELWLDTNLIAELPESITNLRNLTVLDLTKNRLEKLPQKIGTLDRLSDLHLSENAIEALPLDLGNMKALTLLQVDLNHLITIPDSIGELDKVTELLLFDNMLETIPPSLFEMGSLEMLNLDRNHLVEIPSTVGLCKTLHVLSLRENDICEMPEELGYLPQLKVLDIIGNRVKSLPHSYSNLNLDAFWIDSDQPQPLVMLEPQPDEEDPDVTVLCCSLLPQQQGPYIDGLLEISSLTSDQQRGNSINRSGSSVGKGTRLGVAFDPTLGPEPDDYGSKLVRFPTPFHKDLRVIKAKRKKGKYKPAAIPSTTIFRKGSCSNKDMGELELSLEDSPLPTLEEKPLGSLGDFKDFGLKMATKDPMLGRVSPMLGHVSPFDQELREYDEEPVSIISGSISISKDNSIDERGKGDMNASEMEIAADSELPGGGSVVRSVEVTMVIDKSAGQTLGFSIAGGRGSTPAYEDVDDSVYVTKIAPDGVAEKDGRLRLGDKLLSVNHFAMLNATHAEAVAALKSTTSSCHLIVSREVLVVNPDPGSIAEEEEEYEGESVKQDNREGSRLQVLQEQEDQRKKISLTPPLSEQQHDNYVNFDIAQIVANESRKEDKEEELVSKSSGSPLHLLKGLEEAEFSHQRMRSSTGMTQDDDYDDEGHYPEERVILDRTIGKLGLSIVGGADHVSRVFGQGKPGLYVSKISKGGAAEATKKLKLGDRILEVNKFNVRFSTHQQAVQWLISQEGDIELLIQHVDQPPGLMAISLRKEPGQKLGLSIRGGGKGSRGNPLDPNDEGIFISKVAKGGAVHKEGSLKVGMRIIEVNGTSLLGASHSLAVKTLQIGPDLIIIACDGFNPEEVLRMKAVADSLEADRLSSITDSYLPLSAASSMMLDSAIHGLLSESKDSLTMSPSRKYNSLCANTNTSQSATVPPYFSLAMSKMSRSHNALAVTENKDFDSLLEDLAKFRIETSKEVESLDELTQHHNSLPPELDSTILSDIIGPLQNGGLGVLDENAFDQDPVEEDSIASELSRVELKDTSTILADLDSEVSLMHDKALKGEEEMEQAQKEQDRKEETTKVKWRSRKTSCTPVDPSLASPETRRRAEQIRITISPPPDAEASEAAVKSIIGEVFRDISFDEFEQEFVKQESPTHDEMEWRESPEPDHEVDLVSALAEIGNSGKDHKFSPAKRSLKPMVDAAPPTNDKSKQIPNAMNADHGTTDDTISSEVNLRFKTSGNDPINQRSAAMVEKKPDPPLLNPETLTFKEKLALHSKVVDDSPVRAAGSALGKPRSISTPRPAIAPKPKFATPPVNPTSNGGKIPSLSGMSPVEIKKSTNSGRFSVEEKQAAQEMEASSAESSLHHSNPSKTIILSNTNSNNNKTTSSLVKLLLVSPSHEKLQAAENHSVAKQQMAATDRVSATDRPQNHAPQALV